jgi:hypothetical protein
MVQMATQKELLSARTCNRPRTPPVDGSTDRGSWMGNPLLPGELRERLRLLKENDEGTYKTKHAEAARLNYTTTTHRHIDT